MAERLRIVVAGLIAQYPLGGVAWDYGQYALGFARLGHHVTYVEDTGQWPYNPDEGGVSKDCEANVRHLESVMSQFGLAGSWAYRFPWESQLFGLTEHQLRHEIDHAHLVVDVSGALARAEEYRPSEGVLVYIDSDPGFTQVKLALGQEDFRAHVDAHDVHFTFGETLRDSGIPDTGHQWRPTRQPVVLTEWPSPGNAPRNTFTTVMNWTSYKPIEFEGLRLGQKDAEFMTYLDLPSAVGSEKLEIAASPGKTRSTPRGLLTQRGWNIVDPSIVCSDLDDYRDYVASSKAEWSVAKGGYVQTRSGWFSCRSACYLAASRPVVLQDTGFSDVLPVGSGILPFGCFDEAVASIEAVTRDYGRHCRAAREIAEEYFDSDRVLSRLIEEAVA
jgi:hypothetical protein